MKAILLLCVGVLGSPAFSDMTTGEKVEKVGRDVKSATKKGYHSAKEKACEMVNGKMHCLEEKVKDKAEEMKDSVKDTTQDVKDKVD